MKPGLLLFAGMMLAIAPTGGVQSRTVEASETALWPTLPRLAHAGRGAAEAAMERRIAAIVAGMTLDQKIGQMTQADIRSVTPDQARQYYLGSILNGGGAWPNNHKHAGPAEWKALSAAFYGASMTTDMKTHVPIIWGTDAVHGHNNVYGATLFPHNIALGAAHDDMLVMRIARATARAARATGITWVFAPTLAVVQDERWGRSYESYSSDPALVRRYAGAYVRGAQGRLNGPADVIASAKHFIGDGGTFHGKDQGETRVSQADLITTHAPGYYGALGAGVQTVMVSYSSWNDISSGRNWGKMHGNRYLITDVLKGRLGFDGFVVSDWNAIEQVPGCARAHCPAAINAGIDMVMVPDDWKAFIANTVADVRAGTIPMARIDDAVSRILRVKMRSGLFDHDPARTAIPASAIEDRGLAREAVRKSLVLLKNDAQALPIRPGKPILVIGKAADSFPDQSGGWSRTWQGTENDNGDYATGETLLTAIRKVAGPGRVTYSETAEGVDVSRYSAVIAVIGETPYAEMKGDIVYPAPAAHTSRFPEDLAALRRVSGRGVPVVSVFYSGRTVYANDLINRSDAFIAAWLPGTEAGGIADLLFRQAGKAQRYDFNGRLPFAWPADACSTGAGGHIMFARGYGLSYAKPARVGRLAEPAIPATCD